MSVETDLIARQTAKLIEMKREMDELRQENERVRVENVRVWADVSRLNASLRTARGALEATADYLDKDGHSYNDIKGLCQVVGAALRDMGDVTEGGDDAR